MWEQDEFRIHTDVIQCIDSTTYSSELSDEVHFGDQTKTHLSEILRAFISEKKISFE